MKTSEEFVKQPEIFIGLVGPIGVDLEPVQEAIMAQLNELKYETEFIKVTDIMRQFEVDDCEISKNSYSDYYRSLIRYADKFREKCEHQSALAALAISEIRYRRFLRNKNLDQNKNLSDEEIKSLPSQGTAYLIRQFKRPEEIEMMRRVYGRKFIQISVFLDSEERKKSLMKSISEYDSKQISKADCETQAIQLMAIDQNEEKEHYGQRITDVFHLGDVFLQGSSHDNIKSTIARFFNALFGSNAISPTRLEYGMYAAAGASLRSIDLSRQVGAAIFTDEGEILSMGCNEVPKAFGGTYWEDDALDSHRDFERGGDANHLRKREILHDFIERLQSINLLSNDVSSDIDECVQKLQSEKTIKKSQLMDIIEFGRMVHAEMSAITDAARLGRALKGSTLFCTTFPCHMCAKHIVSSGIRRVVFLEPYPKSYAEDLHSDSITFNPNEQTEKVLFEPFIGISPRRYRDIFEKKKRKGDDGKIRPWYEGGAESYPAPRIEDRSYSYIANNEDSAMALGGIRRITP